MFDIVNIADKQRKRLCFEAKKKIRCSTTDTATQAVRAVVGGRSRLNIKERRRPAEDSAMALMISVDGLAGQDGPRAAVSPVHRPSSGK